jgi:hypothetical protein
MINGILLTVCVKFGTDCSVAVVYCRHVCNETESDDSEIFLKKERQPLQFCFSIIAL